MLKLKKIGLIICSALMVFMSVGIILLGDVQAETDKFVFKIPSQQQTYFSFPVGVTVDSSGNVYVADNGNHRIQKFKPIKSNLVDFNKDDVSDLAGLTSNELIFYTTNLSTWTQIPGVLAQLASGDINPARPGYELAGLATDGSIWFTTDFSTWSGVSGALSQLVLGDFDGDGSSDIAGLTSVGTIYYTTYASDFLDWNYIPGVLEQLVE